MNDTPRTDAAEKHAYEFKDEYTPVCESKLVRQLERELNAAHDRINRLEEDSERLHWLLNRGLAWRDCYDNYWIKGEWLYASQDAIETIDKAMEAKP